MRGKIAVLALTALMILGLSVSNALAVNSVNYLGKTTWTAKITDATKAEDIGISFTVTGGISKVGDEFYLFQGYVTLSDDGPFVLSGSGFMNGTTLVFTLSSSQKHTSNKWRDSGVMRVSINKSTLNGTFYDIGTDFNTGTRVFGHRFTAGTLIRSGPPIPLNTSLAPLQ
jgi:hypothetical protein